MYIQQERTIRGKTQEYGIIAQHNYNAITVVPSVIVLEVPVNPSLKEHIAGFEDLCKKVVRMINNMIIFLEN